jgi:hypothetical protein
LILLLLLLVLLLLLCNCNAWPLCELVVICLSVRHLLLLLALLVWQQLWGLLLLR